MTTTDPEGPAATTDAQLTLLRRRLEQDPRSFRDVFVADGAAAVAAEFRRPDLDAGFVEAFWQALLRGDAGSDVLMRFVWDLPLGMKRKLIRGLGGLGERYPMFVGLAEGWPAGNAIPPYTRPAEERAHDFDLVNQGFLGYLGQGYSQREVDLFVWLEALRDKQCADKPCEVGLHIADQSEPQGGCPVKIHIPEMMALLGTGRFRDAMELIEACNPLPNVTGRVCPQELQCQGVCIHTDLPIQVGQLEWFLPQRDKLVDPGGPARRYAGVPDPWQVAAKPPVAIVGSGPAGLINAYLLAAEGFPVAVFEAFHALGGVLRYGIPEFRLPNSLVDDVVAKIRLLGGRFIPNFVVGRTATLQDLRDAGFWKIFVGTGAGLPRFMNVPGEHLTGVMSANEFLARVNLMQGLREDYETPLPETEGRHVLVIGGGNTAMDAARTAHRLGGLVTIVYRRTQDEMPCRVEELHHALEEGVGLRVLAAPYEFAGDEHQRVTTALLDLMELGEPDESGRRRPMPTGERASLPADLVIMALGNASNPILTDAEPELHTTRWGTIDLDHRGSQETSLDGVYSGGDATRGGSTAINAAGDGQTAAREIVGLVDASAEQVRDAVARASAYTEMGVAPHTILARSEPAQGIVELVVHAPLVAQAARAGQFVRLLAHPEGELIPLTLADWDAEAGTITLVVQALGTSTTEICGRAVGEAFTGIAGPLGRPSDVRPHEGAVVLVAGGVGLPPVFPIMREHLRLGNHVTLIAGFRSAEVLFWTGPGERVERLREEFPGLLHVVYTTNDGSFGKAGFVTGPLGDLLEADASAIGEVVAIGPPVMMRAVCELTAPYAVATVASLNSIMVDATGMCGACMVPVVVDGKLVRKHACIDGPEIDGHLIDWDKFLPRFGQFHEQEHASLVRHGLV